MYHSESDPHTLLLDLYGAAQDCTRDAFHEEAFRLIGRQLDFDSAVVLGAHGGAGTALSVHSMHYLEQPLEKLWAHEQLETPDVVLADALQQRGNVLARVSEELFAPNTDVADYCKRFGVAHTMILIPQSQRDNQYELISLWRARRHDHYNAQDVAGASLVLPHFFQARQINARLQPEPGPNDADGVSLLASQSGTLYFVPQPAIVLLQREWPEWTPPRLPPPLIERLGSRRDLSYAGRHLTVQGKVLGHMLHLQCALRRHKPSLTAAERSVAELAAGGMSYKEIARVLDIAPATVRNQLHSVYGKLDIRNKAMLAQVLDRVGAAS